MFNIKAIFEKKESGFNVLNILVKIIEKDLNDLLYSYDNIRGVSSLIASKIAEEVYAEVKDKLLSGDGMLKLQNEIRLDILKKLNEETIQNKKITINKVPKNKCQKKKNQNEERSA